MEQPKKKRLIGIKNIKRVSDKMRSVGILTLGCKVNTYESNVMIDKLINKGYKQVELAEFFEENSDYETANNLYVQFSLKGNYKASFKLAGKYNFYKIESRGKEIEVKASHPSASTVINLVQLDRLIVVKAVQRAIFKFYK